MNCKNHWVNDVRPIKALKIDTFDMDRGVIGLCQAVCDKCGEQFVIRQTIGNNSQTYKINNYPKRIEWIAQNE